MACSKCNTQNTNCGCSDSALTTNPNTLQSTLCPTPIPCSEYVNAACGYINDGIYELGIQPKTSLEETIQKLILTLTNVNCSNATGFGRSLPDNLPNSPTGLPPGSLYTQTAEELGGLGTTKVICIV